LSLAGGPIPPLGTLRAQPSLLHVRNAGSDDAAPDARFHAASRRWWKRILDIAIAVPVLVVLSPLLAIIALAVKVDSRGPILFRQERVGLRGTRFQMLKFRSMRTDIDTQTHAAAAAVWFAAEPGHGTRKSLRDSRITRVGRYLRRTSADELPQLLNVVLGEMSLVGPRPAIPYELEHYEDWYFQRLETPPGMTGLWQVSGRELLTAPEMMRLDVRYVELCSVGLDLLLLVLTVPALLGFAPGARLLYERQIR
jgi:lipopolysaccharide/colanic/teichoic acid biosynthesis glycosyltransferase